MGPRPLVAGDLAGLAPEADQRWEAEMEARALAGVWHGEEDPPPEVQLQWWNAEPPRNAEPPWTEDLPHHDGLPWSASEDTASEDTASEDTASADDTPADDTPEHTHAADGAQAAPGGSSVREGTKPGPSTAGGSWAAAHAAVDAAGLALLHLDRAVGNASAAVGRAWLTDRQDEEAWRRRAAGRVDGARSDLDALAALSADQRGELASLLDRTAGGTLADRPRIAVVDELTGALLALTDSRELRGRAHCGRPACRRRPDRCDHDLGDRPGLRPPQPTDGYRPGAALDRYLRARDHRCRFPGCRRRVPHGGELDHNVPYPDGPTAAENLIGFCTGHHRGKHQAPGWTCDLAPDGTLTVTAPTGLVASTEPPPF